MFSPSVFWSSEESVLGSCNTAAFSSDTGYKDKMNHGASTNTIYKLGMLINFYVDIIILHIFSKPLKMWIQILAFSQYQMQQQAGKSTGYQPLMKLLRIHDPNDKHWVSIGDNFLILQITFIKQQNTNLQRNNFLF